MEKQTMKSLLYLLLSFVLLLGLCACDGRGDPTPTESDTASAVTEETFLTVADASGSRYAIVFPADTMFTVAAGLAQDIKGACGIKVECNADYKPEQEYEILIGATNREQSPTYDSFQSALDWSITVVGKKIVIAGGSEAAVESAVEYFTAQYVKKDAVIVPVGMSHSYASPYNVLELAKITEQIKITGRYSADKNGVTCDWSGAGIEFNAICKGDVSVILDVTVGDAYFAVYVDGVRTGTRIMAPEGHSTIKIASGLSEGEHNIRLVKLNYIGVSNTVLQSLIMDGKLTTAPANRASYIEFIGDSITCGVGLSETPSYKANGSDATRSYAYICAETLGADYSMVSVSGLTLAWSTAKPSKSVIYRYYSYINSLRNSTPYDFANAREPDAVVINLGTNDYNLHQKGELVITEAVFEQDLRALISQIHQNYSADTPIVFVTNTMVDGYQNVIQSVCTSLGGESAGYYVYKAIRNNDALGNHPDREAMKTVGEGLAQFLKDKAIVS